jgi:hypothetical protein
MPRTSPTFILLFIGIFSRLSMCIWVGLVSSIPDHKSEDAKEYTSNKKKLMNWYPLSTLTKWDSAHFLEIVQSDGYGTFHGKEKEMSRAFYPFYPWLVHTTLHHVSPPPPSTKLTTQNEAENDYHNERIVIFAAIISNACCILAGLFLYHLGLNIGQQVHHHSSSHSHHRYHVRVKGVVIFKDMSYADIVSFLAAILFYFSPASIFFFVAYSESLFACLSFAGSCASPDFISKLFIS